MWFDTEICEGVSCHECSFNKGEDGCLLAKRLDEIEIIPEPCEDALKKIKKDAIGIILHVAKISKHCSDFNDLDEVPECEDAVSKADVLETYADLYDVFEDNKQISKELHKVYDKLNALPSAQKNGYTKADYIMALHKEYGCSLARAEKAHQKALEYLRNTSMMKG